jgi:WhiB family transcriptional regulator, redox-sensing transcriptional regulator
VGSATARVPVATGVQTGETAVDFGRPRTGWREAAACRGCSPSLFFPRDEAEEEVPKAVCARCAVRVDCLVDAILRREIEGVRGGMNERERRSLSRKLKRRARQAGCSTAVAMVTCLGEAGVLASSPPRAAVELGTDRARP